MAKPLDPNELVSFKELLMANSIQVDALVQLLIEEGLNSEQRFFQKLKQVQAQYQQRQTPCLRRSSPGARPVQTEQPWTLPSSTRSLTEGGCQRAGWLRTVHSQRSTNSPRCPSTATRRGPRRTSSTLTGRSSFHTAS